MASPEYSTTWLVPPAMPILPMMARMMSFAETPLAPLAVHHNAHRLGFILREALRGQHVFDFAGADAEGQRAEGAVRGRVAIAAHNCLARLRDAEFRADHVHDALVMAEHVEQRDAELAAIALEGLELPVRGRIQNRQIAILRGDGMIHDGKREIGTPHRPSRRFQSGKGLRGSAFVNQMAVNIDQRRFSRRLADQVRFPNLAVHCA